MKTGKDIIKQAKKLGVCDEIHDIIPESMIDYRAQQIWDECEDYEVMCWWLYRNVNLKNPKVRDKLSNMLFNILRFDSRRSNKVKSVFNARKWSLKEFQDYYEYYEDKYSSQYGFTRRHQSLGFMAEFIRGSFYEKDLLHYASKKSEQVNYLDLIDGIIEHFVTEERRSNNWVCDHIRKFYPKIVWGK